MELQPANELVEAARGGDRAAAGELVEMSYARVYAFLRRLVGNDLDAEDLTQRAFARIWQSLPTFAARSSVSSWMHGVAYHVYVDWRRVAQRGETRSDEWWATCALDAAGPDEALSKSDHAAAIYAAVDRLEPQLRETVHLHFYQELTLQETADAQGVATSTVKYRLRQALEDLRKKFADQTIPMTTPIVRKAI